MVLGELIRYVYYHFGEEERMMEAAGYDDLAAHRQSHRIMAEHVRALEVTYDRDPSAVVAAELHAFLGDWLIHHIRSEDARYAPCLSQKTDASESLRTSPIPSVRLHGPDAALRAASESLIIWLWANQGGDRSWNIIVRSVARHCRTITRNAGSLATWIASSASTTFWTTVQTRISCAKI
jgi:hypothetical protein